MRKVFAILRREFVERVRTRWFWVGTILGPLLMVGIIGFQILLSTKKGGERHIAIVDATTTEFGRRLVTQLAVAVPRIHMRRVIPNPTPNDWPPLTPVSLRPETLLVARRIGICACFTSRVSIP